MAPVGLGTLLRGRGFMQHTTQNPGFTPQHYQPHHTHAQRERERNTERDRQTETDRQRQTERE